MCTHIYKHYIYNIIYIHISVMRIGTNMDTDTDKYPVSDNSNPLIPSKKDKKNVKDEYEDDIKLTVFKPAFIQPEPVGNKNICIYIYIYVYISN
jgi:hypothetical protein